MMDEEDVQNAEVGDQVTSYSKYDIKTGRIKAFSPRRASMQVEWTTGATSTINHRKYGNITLADPRERRQRP